MNDSNQSLLSYELELYKELNKAEQEYRNRYSDRAFKSIMIIVSLAGALLWLIFNRRTKTGCLLDINIICLAVSIVTLLAAISIFFFVVYGYNEMGINPQQVKLMLEDYKSETDNENDIINVADQSLLISYKNSAINNYKQNRNRAELFSVFYILIFVEIVLLVITFIVAVLL